MRIGLSGAGNMAAALARGWGDQVVLFDPDEARAAELAAEVGGETVASNRELAQRADAIVLCHKPAQLEEVAAEVGETPSAVITILGGTPVAEVERAYPGAPVYRFMPNMPAEVRRGVFCYAPGTLAADGPEAEVLELFGRLGTVVPVEEPLMDAATALMGCAPAFFAVVVEALVDAGVRHGLQAGEAARMVVETMAGTAALLAERDHDTADLRRRVTSPGGSTARGLVELERGGVRTAFADAVAAVVRPPR
jgi:pyrroline-5-carboxylate reductase